MLTHLDQFAIDWEKVYALRLAPNPNVSQETSYSWERAESNHEVREQFIWQAQPILMIFADLPGTKFDEQFSETPLLRIGEDAKKLWNMAAAKDSGFKIIGDVFAFRESAISAIAPDKTGKIINLWINLGGCRGGKLSFAPAFRVRNVGELIADFLKMRK